MRYNILGKKTKPRFDESILLGYDENLKTYSAPIQIIINNNILTDKLNLSIINRLYRNF